MLVGNVEVSNTGTVSLDISEVTYVTLCCVGCTVLGAGWLQRGRVNTVTIRVL